MRLAKSDRIMTAYAEPCSGPGWANSPVVVIVKDENGRMREECLQPDEQPAEMISLYEISCAINRRMVDSASKPRAFHPAHNKPITGSLTKDK